MVESRLPWWLVLLLGVWVAGLTLWAWPRAQRQVRWGAGLLSLVYLVLLFLALGGDPRPVATTGAVPRGLTAVSWSFLVSGAAALLAGVCLLGRPAPGGQLIWFLVLTLANATSCLICGATSVGGALLMLAAVTGIILARERGWSARLKWHEWIPASNSVATQSVSAPTALVGMTGFVLALLLVGTLGYVMRVETSRATASHRFSALPSADRVRVVLGTDTGRDATADPIEFVFDQRADVIVLLTALTFIVVAMNLRSRTAPIDALMGGERSDSTGLGNEEVEPGKSPQPPVLRLDGSSPRGATS